MIGIYSKSRRSLSFHWTFARESVGTNNLDDEGFCLVCYTQYRHVHRFFLNQSITCLHILGPFHPHYVQRHEEGTCSYPHFMGVENKTQKMEHSFSKTMAMAGPGLRPPDPVLFLCHQTECQQGSDCRTPQPLLNPLPAQHQQGHYCPRLPTPVTPQPRGLGEMDLPSSASSLALPGPLPRSHPGDLSLQGGWGQDVLAGYEFAAASPAKGSAELKEEQLEPSGVLTCAPAFGLQGIAPGLSSMRGVAPCSRG